MASSNPQLGECKEVWFIILRFFMFLSAVSLGFSLVLDPRGRLGGRGGKVGSTCEGVIMG